MDRIWRKIYGDKIPAEIDLTKTASVVSMLESAMKTYADRTAYVSFMNSLTYADVDRLSAQFAAYLQTKLGVKKGDRIALMAPNILAFPVAMFGILRAGGVQVNVNPLYTPRELEHQLNDAGVETIIIFSGSTPTLAAIQSKTSVRNVIVADIGDFGHVALPSPPVSADLKSYTRLADAVAESAAADFRPVQLTQADLLFLQYTGGTTGVSKGAMLSHGNLVANILQINAFAPQLFRPGQEIVITAIPLYHVFALMVNCLSYFAAGATNILIADPRNMDSFVKILKDSKFSIITGVNTLFAGLALHPEFPKVDFSNYLAALGGGAAVFKATSDKWKSITGHHIKEGFGLSETSPIVTFNPPHLDDFTETVGIPMPSTEVSLRDDNGVEVPLGQPGEFCVKGPQVMAGYWGRLQDNDSVFWPDGYFKTGDIAVVNEDGYFKIVDRKKDMIIVSGFNVFPNDIEAVVQSFPGVAECACIGVPDAKTGEAVNIFVVKAP
ncbi:MAG: AMP-binding protein, partial [Rhizobiaceae bacterium]